MKIIRNIIILFFIVFATFSFFSYAKCTTIDEEESIKKGTPSSGFLSEQDNNYGIMLMSEKQTYTEGNYQYQIKENYRITATDINNNIISDKTEDVAIITKYTGNETTVTIPKKLGGKRVYEIERAVFYQNTTIKKLIIQDDSVGYIGEGAFAECINLSEVILGNSVNNITYYAFQNTAITSIKLPASLETIQNTAFFKCSKLTNITIDSKNVHLKAVNNVIYSLNANEKMDLILYPYAKSDKTFSVPNDVKSIQKEAIINDYVETINISSSIENINFSTYALMTSNLKTINVDKSNPVYSSVDGVLFSKDKKKIYLYPAGRTEDTYNIPNGTQIIEEDSFIESYNLKYIKIPDTVTELKIEAFGYAKGLEEITIPSSVTKMGAQIFIKCPKLKKVTVNANTDLLSYLMFNKCENLEEVIINGKIKTIIKGAFYYCEKLTKVTLPNSLERINFGAFWDCNGLKKITIPSNVMLMENCAFYNHYYGKEYWADTELNILNKQLKKQNDGSYIAVYDYNVKGTRCYDKAFEVLNLVNQERKKMGYKEISMDKELLEDAMLRAEEIVTYFEHERPNGLTCDTAITKIGYYYAAENIAVGQSTSASVMNSWMNSEGHKNNILENYYTTCIGVGCYLANDGKYYWVQIFTNGTPENVTKPNNKQTVSTIKILANRTPFSDVKTSEWYYNAINYCVSNKIMSGVNSSTFLPNQKLTRAMLVTMLHNMEGQPYVSGKSKFHDVQDTNQWYYVAIKWASQNNIISGYSNGKFGPNDLITREQFAVILNQYCIYKGKYKTVKADLSKFKDSNKISDFAKWGMNWAVGNGIINGSQGKLNPINTATRAEAAAMLSNYCHSIK